MLFSGFFTEAMLIAVRCYFTEALICFFNVNSEHPFKWLLLICVSPPKQWLFTDIYSHIFKSYKKMGEKIPWAWCSGVACKAVPAFHMDRSSSPGYSISDSAPCVEPGKACGDGPKPWSTAPTWETQKQLCAPGFRPNREHFGHYKYLESEQGNVRCFRLFISPPVTLPFN